MREYIEIKGHLKTGIHFFDLYSEVFALFRDHQVRLLEIGVNTGNSLKIWKQYFMLADIWGLDINPECKKFEGDRVTVIIGDQTDRELLATLPSFDIIIDDGGHTMKQQQISFEVLYPKLNQEGWYFIEDLNTSYGGEEKEWYKGKSTVAFLKDLLDNVILPFGMLRPNYPDWQVSEMRFVSCLVGIKK